MEKELLDLTAPQKSIWLTEQFYANTNINNICATAIIHQEMDFNVLTKAINLVITSNDNFKLRFVNENGILKQYFENVSEKKFEIIEIESENDLAPLEQKLLSRIFNFDEELFEIKIFKVKNSSICGCLINVHHIIADAYTMGLICKDVMNNYSKLIINEPIVTNENFSYKKYIENEKEYIKSEKFITDKQYWNEQFESLPNIVTIPSKNQLSTVSTEANRYIYKLNKEDLDKISDFCSQNKISIFNLFMTTLALYMYKINNTNEFVIGTPILNRTNFNEKNTLGMFINVSPLRISIDNNLTIKELIGNITKDTLGLMRHQKYSYQYILEDLRKKYPTIPNLYNVILSYQITKTTSDSDIDYTTRWVFNGHSANDIEIQIIDQNNLGSLEICYDYKTSKYNQDEISNINNRLLELLTRIISLPNQLVSEIDIITEKEKDILLNQFNDTYLPYDPYKSIIETFENQVSTTPHEKALTFKNTSYTYYELNCLANVLAHKLKQYGIKNNSIVSILIERSPEIIVSILAILKVGAAYLPIDVDYPANRIEDILTESNVDLVLIKNTNFDLVKKYKYLEVNLEDLNITELNSKNIPNVSNPQDLSYIIYTSGSTGKPKGVTLTNKNYSNFLASMKNKIEYLKSETKLSIISITTISFDIFGFESIVSLCCGLHLYLTDYFEQKQTQLLEDYIVKNKIDIIQTTPSIMYHHIRNLTDKKHFSNLKYYILAGEPLTKSLVQEIKSINPNAVIYNGYGPSETTIFSTITEITSPDDIVIGKPVNNTQIYILDENQKLVPMGIVGEIYISGDGVGAGYLNRPDLTKDAYFPNPFGQGIMYKTGDIGYWREDGNIICNGRKDTQIKLNGLRIEISEIESKINTFFNNKNRICIVLQTIDSTPTLHCFIENANTNLDLTDLKNYLLLNLPNYMIPHHYTILNQFPQTANGKINKKELKTILPSAVNTTNTNIKKPTNDIEQTIYDIISGYVNMDNYGITDDFFSIGLDSLTIINIVIDINTKFNSQLSVSDIYTKLNIKELASSLSNKPSEQNYSFSDYIKNSSYFETSSAQKRIFYANQLSSVKPGVYNISGGIIFNEILDYEKIEDCFNIIIENNDAFKTYFELYNGNLIQKIANNIYFKANCIHEKEENIDSIFLKFNKSFDLKKAPLLRCLIIYTETNKTIILISMHHIISDGTSLQILLDEFLQIYNNKPLPQKKFNYKDFINYENYFFGSYQYNANKKFWLNEFSEEVPTLNLPTTYSRPSVFSYKGAKITDYFDEETSSQIIEKSKELEVTPYMFLLTIYYILLYKYTGQNNIVVGTPIANRDIPEFSKIIGMFVNTLAIRKKIHSDRTFNAFLNEVKEKCLNCFSHQNFPFEELVRELNIERDISRNPIFDTMFIYQKDLSTDNFDIQYFAPDTKISKFDISIEIIPKTNFQINLEYCTDLFEKKFANQFLNHFITLTKNVLHNCNTKISELNVLTLEEKNKILFGFNNTRRIYDENNYLYKAIDSQALKTPDYTAITFKDTKLTYKELYEKTNSLANYLRKHGIGRNSIVGIMVPRSLELLVGIIATLKTGACYIPIDPSFPESRISYMLENSNAQLLLTFDNISNSSTDNISIQFSNLEVYSENNSLDFEYYNESSDPSYIIYTSGSTGNPKGVVLNHKALTNLTNYLNNYVQYLKEDYGNMAIASLTTVSFDIFIFETLISLQKGLNVIMATENEQTMPESLNHLIQKNDVKAFQLTPSRMEILLNNKKLIPSLSNIKYITLAGEAVQKKLLDSILELGDITVYNGYGPSETTVFSTFTDITHHKKITIGKPLDNTYIYIFDKDDNICPINVPGELCICGDGVGIGYKNIPSTTKNNYTISPISQRPMYRTGDLAKYLQNGEISYIGRIDNQVKIRGLRIELDEIESKISEFPNIKNVIVLAKTDSNNRTCLVAYLTVLDKISISKLREFLRKYLPKYMVPSYYEILDEFPYLPNGKVNKKALPDPKIKLFQENYVPPRDDLDKKILEIFEKLLNLSPIGITDNFFELGGDSLLAINLQIELMKITDGISYSDIFLNPTVKELAYIIKNINDTIESLSNTVELLNCNTCISDFDQLPVSIPENNIGNILLTGATGYLGAHVLKELIDSTDKKIYCLIRLDKGLTLKEKLLNSLHFYFDNELDNLINKRIFIIQGDISQDSLGMSANDIELLLNNVSLIINCAAKVSHFGKYELYKKINVDGVKNIIEFCKKNSMKFYHISTASVSGDHFNKIDDPALVNVSNQYRENNFYINQLLDNVYVKSKFEAERLIISQLRSGLDAYIFRIGNIMGRYSDGKFQKNIEENAYINRILSFIRIKNIPQIFSNHYLEFTPVDCCAKAIVKLVTHSNDKNRIFHLLDNKKILIKDLIKVFEEKYYPINLVSNEDFKNVINRLIQSSNSHQYLNGLISDFDKKGKLDYIKDILVYSDFSDEYLRKLDFEWPEIDSEYISKFLNYLNNLYKF